MASNSQFFEGVSSASSPQNRPAVPMSVYRELAGELQATKNQLEQFKQENQQLHQQNRSLRLEIRQLVQSVQKLESIISYWDEHSQNNFAVSEPSPVDKINDDRFRQQGQETWFAHQEERSPQQPQPSQRSQEINGWFVAATIVMIIVTFSGMGFMIARPLINNTGE